MMAVETKYEFVLDCGSLYIHQWQGIASRTTVVPLNMALMACELLTCCKSLLSFIEAHNMGGDWCQDNYPSIQKARETVRQAER